MLDNSAKNGSSSGDLDYAVALVRSGDVASAKLVVLSSPEFEAAKRGQDVDWPNLSGEQGVIASVYLARARRESGGGYPDTAHEDAIASEEAFPDSAAVQQTYAKEQRKKDDYVGALAAFKRARSLVKTEQSKGYLDATIRELDSYVDATKPK